MTPAPDSPESATQRRLVQAERELDRARAESVRLRHELERLRGRRSVRVALRLAAFARPLFAVVTTIRRRRAGAPRPTTGWRPAARPDTGPAVAASEVTVDVVVCVHDALDDTRRCIEALREHTDLHRHGVVLVDDGSAEPTARYLDEVAGSLPARLIRHETARGYTVAASAGLAAGTGDFAVLLNSDTVVTAQWLDRMLACATEDAAVAAVGPLSNAASWQSIPRLRDDSGQWADNPLPASATPDDVATALHAGSGEPLWPDVRLLNGFCYLVRRRAYESIGGLDTQHFPRGYGEEDDLSLRLVSDGWRLRVSDDAYVHHAKSRSFTAVGRQQIVATARQTLQDLHGPRLERAVASQRRNELLLRARRAAGERVRHVWDGRPEPPDLPPGIRVAWVQPHLGLVGGVRRAVTMCRLMASWGARPVLVSPDGRSPDWIDVDTPVLDVATARTNTFDVVVVSDPEAVDMALALSASRRVVYHLGAYSLYRRDTPELRRYLDIPDAVHLANSRWTADHVERTSGRPIVGIVPGAVDPTVFHPVASPVTADVVCYGSDRAHKGTSTIVAAADGLRLQKLVDLYLDQEHLAAAISAGRVFVSGARHEGFNLPPLEAMACGVPVVMTDDGGSRDYAVDGVNALVVPVDDVRAMRRAIRRLLDDAELRVRLIDGGFDTAGAHRWDEVTRRFVEHIVP